MPSRNFFTIIVSLFFCYACYSVAVKNRDAVTLAEALDIVQREALYERSRPELFQSAMKGLLSDLDAYSSYLSGDVFRSFDEDIDGQFGGVGVYFENVRDQGMYVLAVMPGHPADKSGIQAGDLVISVDGKSTLGLDRSEVGKLMRGKVGQKLVVDYLRNGETRSAEIVRATIPLTSVHGYRRNRDGSWDYRIADHPKIAYIHIKQFADPTTAELKQALTQLTHDVEAIIFDLRNNPGGLLTCATDICDLFLPPGLTIVSTRGRSQEILSEIKSVTEPAIDPQIPLVVLLNRSSASASEIMAGCLQDHNRATIIGEQSWGKGTVQKVIQMKQGSAALKLTTASYWRPSGKNIDRYDQHSKETGLWGVRPQQEFAVALSEIDLLGQLKQMQDREIRGLIPADQQDSLMQLSAQRFKESLKESLNQNQSNTQHKDQIDPPVAVVSGNGTTPRNSPSPPNSPQRLPADMTDSVDADAIDSIDLQRDSVLEKAIEFLTRPANLKKIAA
jgi:carboxyl-terminal processing protease